MKMKRKGFTLVELVIVMALFSVVMFGVAQLMSPVSKFYARTSNYESSTACIDNIKRAIEGNLKYADRVRVYQNFDPGTNLDTHVQQFWAEFFEDRQFLDCQGTIYALTFDNNAPNVSFDSDPNINSWVISGYNNLEDFADAQLNSGEITLYEYNFTNSTPPTLANTTPWYVNQKMYGNYEYQFRLGGLTVSGSVGAFDPADCTITITSHEISRNHAYNGNRLVVNSTGNTESASFSMKNVLDPATNYNTPLDDFKLIFDNATATYSVSGPKRYIMDTTPHPRYATMIQNPFDLSNPGTIQYGGDDLTRTNAAIPGFYFIFTMPDSVQDDVDTEYMTDVDSVFNP